MFFRFEVQFSFPTPQYERQKLGEYLNRAKDSFTIEPVFLLALDFEDVFVMNLRAEYPFNGKSVTRSDPRVSPEITGLWWEAWSARGVEDLLE